MGVTTIDYAKHGLDAATLLDPNTHATGEAYAALQALVEADVDAHTYVDPEDKAVVAERVSVLAAKAEEKRKAAKLTKREFGEIRRAILQESATRLATVHLNIRANEERGMHPDGQTQHKERVEALYDAVTHHLTKAETGP